MRMRTDEEREEYDLMRGRLMLIARTLEAVKDIPDDGSSSYAMDTIIREDVPAALTIIDRLIAEGKRMRDKLLYIASFEHASLRDCDINVNELGEEAREALGMTWEEVMAAQESIEEEEMRMTDEQLIDVVKLCIQVKAPILKSDAQGLLWIIDRQRAELQELRNVAKVAEDYIRDGGVAYAQRTACREYRCMERSDVR